MLTDLLRGKYVAWFKKEGDSEDGEGGHFCSEVADLGTGGGAMGTEDGASNHQGLIPGFNPDGFAQVDFKISRKG